MGALWAAGLGVGVNGLEASTYTVRKGDSLSSISRQLGLNPSDLAKLNGIRDPDKILVGQRLTYTPGSGGSKTYIVRKGDSLSSISRRFGVRSTQLARANGIHNPNRISVGQKLRIPAEPVGWASHPALPEKLSSVRVSSRWRNIVIHHSASRSGTMEGMDRYHREERHMENGLAYHFVIGNGRGMKDGEIALGNRWRRQLNGGHLASSRQNRNSIGICLVGNFDKQRPTRRQMESLRALVHYLVHRCGLDPSAVKSHQEINVIHTRCPGKHFPLRSFKRDLGRG